MDKHKAVREHLREHGSITTYEAIEKYGATRLSAIIWDLRHDNGMKIETVPTNYKDRYGHTVIHATYRLVQDAD